MGKADFREWIKADFQGVELGRLKCVMIDFFSGYVVRIGISQFSGFFHNKVGSTEW